MGTLSIHQYQSLRSCGITSVASYAGSNNVWHYDSPCSRMWLHAAAR
ncbi:MAG: hypothetical protein H7Y30_10445 [Pyrinomonadaceae bacterium]|nr:hypothetical protein [Pyrinomonadaceae bacterium]